MKLATKCDVNFWGLIILANLTTNLWFAGIFTLMAAWNLYLIFKGDDEQSETNLDNGGRGEHGCANGACEQSSQPKQRRNRTKAAEVPSKE